MILEDLRRIVQSSTTIVVVSVVLLVLVEQLLAVQWGLSSAIVYVAYWGVLILTFVGLSVWSWRDGADEEIQTARVVVVGALIGGLVAAHRLVVHQELWAWFNLLAEPVRTALVGYLVSWLARRATTNSSRIFAS